MAREICIPRLGWNMEEGIFLGWHRRDGENIRAGEPLFTLEGEKAAQEVEADDDGTLWIDPNGPKAGQVVPVGIPIGAILRPGEGPPATTHPARNHVPTVARAAPDAESAPRRPGVTTRGRPRSSP